MTKCLLMEIQCPNCGCYMRSLGAMDVVGWECGVCDYYDPSYEWLQNKVSIIDLDVDFEELDNFEKELDEYYDRTQNH